MQRSQRMAEVPRVVTREPNQGLCRGPHLDIAPLSPMTASRILDRLMEAEMSEPEIWFRQDYRQAFICVSLASRGEAQPFVTSSYRIFGIHPDNVWPQIMAKRKAKLGKEFPEWFDQAGNLQPDIPKKTSLPITPHPDVQVPVRLAAVLMFPRIEAHDEDVEQTDSERRPKESKGNLYEMPSKSPSEKPQPLRILFAETEDRDAS